MRKTREDRCEQKVPYKTKALALRGLKILKIKSRNKYTADLKPYLCNVCGKWHLGHRQRNIDIAFEQLKESEDEPK
jgi:hypothetical protein